MIKWSRTNPFESQHLQYETWICFDEDTGARKEYSVEVTLGKPIDIISLKSDTVANFDFKAAQIRYSNTHLFEGRDLQRSEFCPICGYKTDNSIELLKVYGAKYIQCRSCSHCFLFERPTELILEEFYSNSSNYQSEYTNKRTIDIRVEQVALPKVKWIVGQFERIYGRKPTSVLDIGAGSGHFVHACRISSMKADGIELSAAGRKFCLDNFGIEMLDNDFLEDYSSISDYDIITFWGVLEHVPYALDMLNTASKLLSERETLVAVEVPRWNCMSTSVQSVFTGSILRHLVPLNHIHCFTDTSLATAFKSCGLDIVAAWYYGMDAYELITQLSFFLKENRITQELGECIPIFQNLLDLSKLSDEMVFVGKPSRMTESG